jgi:hypothetical protein
MCDATEVDSKVDADNIIIHLISVYILQNIKVMYSLCLPFRGTRGVLPFQMNTKNNHSRSDPVKYVGIF